MKEFFDIKDYCVIITGANRGLGKEMALAFADCGANVVITCRDLNSVAELVKVIEKKNVQVLPIKMDVRNEDEINQMVEDVMEKFGKIDVLVNNAAICQTVEVENMKTSDWNETIDVNLTGVFQVSKAVGRKMILRKKGSIINISSISGFIMNHPQKHTAYCVSKAGVIMLTKGMAAEWAEYNIRVNSVAPGYTTGGMAKSSVEEGGEMAERWRSLIPMHRFGKPGELSGILIYLASEASTYTTGATFLIDGGFTVW